MRRGGAVVTKDNNNLVFIMGDGIADNILGRTVACFVGASWRIGTGGVLDNEMDDCAIALGVPIPLLDW
jgi:hypothetical protein